MNELISSKNIIKSIKKITNPNNKYFYDKIINYFENNKINTFVKENIYELTGLILYLLSNYKNFNIGIIVNKDISKNIICRKKILTKKQLVNLYYCLRSNNFTFDDIKNIKNNNTVYICVSKDPLNFDITPPKINYCSLTQLFGVENFNILNYINFKRFLKLSNTKAGKHSLSELKKYSKFIKKYKDDIQANSCVLSSSVLYVTGVTTSEDVDIALYNKNENLNSLIEDILKTRIDMISIDKNNQWFWKKTDKNENWLTVAMNEWIESVGGKQIEDIFLNSVYHFYIFGCKFISFDLEISRLYKRNRATSYADLIAVKTYTTYDIDIKCVKRIRMNRGQIIFIDEQEYNKMLKTIKFYMKDWHNKNYSIEDLKKILPLCPYKPFDKYIASVNTHNLFNNLRIFHKHIKEIFITKYCSNCDLLLDVGSGYLKSLKFWKKAHIKKIIAMEPSESLYKSGVKFQNKNIFAKKNVIYLQSVGNKNWLSGNSGINEKSKKMLKKLKGLKANCITFEFTIHYMINKIKTLMKNIINFSKKNTKVIIHCLNGDVIMDLLKNNNKFSVYNNKNLVFFIEKKFKMKDDFKKIDIYFKGGQGLDNVISEYIVEPKKIIDTFIDNGFELLEFTKFMENNPTKFGLHKYELQVSNLYTTYVFNYKK